MPATFQGTSFLLTYPQDAFDLDSDFDTAREFFGSLAQLKYLRIGVERHESGEPHWHALVLFAVKLRAGARAFDFRGRHPNVQTVGRRVLDWQRCHAYVAKDGEYRDFGDQRHSKESVWAEVVQADDRETALKLIAAAAPRDFIIHRRNVDYALEALFPVRPCSSFQPRDPSSFRVPDALLRWLSQSVAYE